MTTKKHDCYACRCRRLTIEVQFSVPFLEYLLRCILQILFMLACVGILCVHIKVCMNLAPLELTFFRTETAYSWTSLVCGLYTESDSHKPLEV